MNTSENTLEAGDREQEAQDLNTLSAFLARQDLADLTPESLAAGFGVSRADLLILLGSSVLATAEAAARGLRNGVAEHLLIVGGVGHSTDYLRAEVQKDPRFHRVEVEGRTEAEILRDLMVSYFGVKPESILLETRSTNCGANAIEARTLLQQRGWNPRTIILIQDPTMQLRTDASFRLAWRDDPEIRFVNYAPFVPRLEANEGALRFVEREIVGRWEWERFLALVMGELPRLRDDANGYGPRGRGFIAHVDIPPEVEA